jgi:heptosyltransferase-2
MSVDNREQCHEILRGSQVLATLGVFGNGKQDGPEVWLRQEDEQVGKRVLGSTKPNMRLIALAPGARSAVKCWPIENYLALARKLTADSNVHLIMLGGMREHEDGSLIENALRGSATNLCGKLSLRQSAAMIKQCAILVCNDSGLAHVGAAVGTRVLVINGHPKDGDPMAMHSPVRFAPWSPRAIVVQPETALPPCSAECVQDRPHCITQIGVEEVLRHVKEMYVAKL